MIHINRVILTNLAIDIPWGVGSENYNSKHWWNYQINAERWLYTVATLEINSTSADIYVHACLYIKVPKL